MQRRSRPVISCSALCRLKARSFTSTVPPASPVIGRLNVSASQPNIRRSYRSWMPLFSGGPRRLGSRAAGLPPAAPSTSAQR